MKDELQTASRLARIRISNGFYVALLILMLILSGFQIRLELAENNFDKGWEAHKQMVNSIFEKSYDDYILPKIVEEKAVLDSLNECRFVRAAVGDTVTLLFLNIGEKRVVRVDE